MDFVKNDFTLFENVNNTENDTNSYMIVSKSDDVEYADFDKVIQMIDEDGNEVNCTYNKFLEIFDNNEETADFII